MTAGIRNRDAFDIFYYVSGAANFVGFHIFRQIGLCFCSGIGNRNWFCAAHVSELGDYSMEYDLKTPEQQAEVCNVVRFAIDRDRLSKEHLDYVIAAVSELYKDRASIPNMRIVWGHNLPMRHFHAFLEPYAPTEAEK